MCFEFIFFKKPQHKDFTRLQPCSCDICGANFDTMSDLIGHMGFHSTEDINKTLRSGHGTVRCNTCWRSFKTVADIEEHTCSTVISGLSPVQSRDSLDSVLIHD
jgi:hypothetical protein